MYSAGDLVPAIQRAAVAAVESAKPLGLFYGTVLSASPLSVQISPELTLGAAQLSLTSAVSSFTVNMTVEHETEEGGQEPHKHDYKGTKAFTVLLGLQPGEKVLLLRAQGGQQYLVLDRVRGAAR